MAKAPLTRFQYERDMVLGRIAFWVVIATPKRFVLKWPTSLLGAAGFYAYDDVGYDEYAKRWEAL